MGLLKKYEDPLTGFYAYYTTDIDHLHPEIAIYNDIGEEIFKTSCEDTTAANYEWFEYTYKLRRHWDSMIEWRNHGDLTPHGHVVARVQGTQYVILPEDARIGIRGFGGRTFIFYFFDGREIVSTNVFTHGRIPRGYLPFLPDNAAMETPL